MHCHFEGFAAAAKARAAHRRRAEVIQADRDPHMGFGGADPVGRVEADPSEVLDIGFDPGVAGVLLGDAIDAVEMPAHIARRDAELARRRDENVGEVLADAAAQREGFRRRGRGMGRIGVEFHLAIERIQSPCSSGSGSLPASARALSAKSMMAASGCVSAVSRRNSPGGKLSTAPLTTLWVSWVSTSPSTATDNSLNGPSAVKE